MTRFNHFIVLFLLCWGSLAFAHNPGKSEVSHASLVEYLAQEKTNLTLAINEAKLKAMPTSETQFQEDEKQNVALRDLNQGKLSNLEGFLETQQKIQQNYNQRLKYLQLSNDTPLTIHQKIAKLTASLDVNQKTIALIKENLSLLKKYQEILEDKNSQLTLWKSEHDMQKKVGELHAKENKLKNFLNFLYETNVKLQHEKMQGDFSNRYHAEAKLLLNNQLINLTNYKIAEIDLQKQLVKADFSLVKNPDFRTLQGITEIYQEVINQLAHIEESLKSMALMIKNEQQHLTDARLKQQYAVFIRLINEKITELSIQEETLQEDLYNHQQALKNQLSVRQSLAEYHLNSFSMLMKQFTDLPKQVYTYIKALSIKFRDNYLWQDHLPTIFIILIVTCIILIAFGLHQTIKGLTYDQSSRLSARLYDGLLILINKNIPHLTLFGLIILIFYLSHIPASSYQMLTDLALTWICFRSLMLIARIILLERVTDASGIDVRLYYRIKWLLLVGAWITVLMVLSAHLTLSILLQDLFNRLLMVYILMISVVAWKSREVVTHLLEPIIETKKKYIYNAVMLLIILLPLTLLTTAIFGLVGYINLAWTMSRYQIEILLMIAAYVLLRGLLADVLEVISEWMISSLHNGWLWIEVGLKPIDKILRIFLTLGSLTILFHFFGFHSDSQMMIQLKEYSHYPLVNLSGIYITPISILGFFIVLCVFIWAAKWTREFAYRWLYRHTRDVGLRNSLSVFTQYSVAIIGGIIAFRELGFDFSGMSMILGGLAVGMGFGLRDFASNIVGGLMLLIERPVREGDFITIGQFEGQVSHIGIRSMRVCSWDNMEVLIPNAEIVNKPFTNWTHQDGIVRTVIPIKVCRSDDPIIVQQIIYDVLAVIPEIVTEPAAQVFLRQISEALVEFEVRYYIDVQRFTRFEIQSKVLFAITEEFKKAGIKPPIPPLEIDMKQSEQEIYVSTRMDKKPINR